MTARARSLLLFIVFLASGTSLPSLDALIYHSRGADVQGERVHLEPAGRCPSHSAHCTLGRIASGSGAVATDVSGARFEPTVAGQRMLAPTPPPVTTEPNPFGHPRPPPTQLS